MTDPAEAFHARQAATEDAIAQAYIYWRGGAIASAARKLDAAADLAREAQAIRNTAFGIVDPETAPTVRIPSALLAALDEFFGRTMGLMRFDTCALDAQAIANWNECSRAIAKLKREAEQEAGADG